MSIVKLLSSLPESSFPSRERSMTTGTKSSHPSEVRTGVPNSATARPRPRTVVEIGALISNSRGGRGLPLRVREKARDSFDESEWERDKLDERKWPVFSGGWGDSSCHSRRAASKSRLSAVPSRRRLPRSIDEKRMSGEGEWRGKGETVEM